MDTPITWLHFFYFTLAMLPANILAQTKNTTAGLVAIAWAVVVWTFVLVSA